MIQVEFADLHQIVAKSTGKSHSRLNRRLDVAISCPTLAAGAAHKFCKFFIAEDAAGLSRSSARRKRRRVQGHLYFFAVALCYP